MRKVAKKDEVPISFMSPQAIEYRVNKFNNREIPKPLKAKVHNRINEFVNLEHMDVKRDLDKLYKTIDEFMNRMVYPSSVCRKGCGYCCSIPVDVSLIEAARISIYLQQELEPNIVTVTEEDKYAPCPFQTKDFTCGIYPVRPLNCRLFASIDSWHPCRDEEQHMLHANKSNSAFIQLNDHLERISGSAQKQAKNLPVVADIRAYFGTQSHDLNKTK